MSEQEEKNVNESATDPALSSLSRSLDASFRILKISMIAVLALYIIKQVHVVDQGSQALLKRFGAYVTDEDGKVKIYQPGKFVLVWPEPIEKLETFKSKKEESIVIDSDMFPKLKMGDTAIGAPPIPVREKLDPKRDGYCLGADYNIIHSQWIINYTITDIDKYQQSSISHEETKEMIKSTVISCIIRSLGSITIDDIYSQGINKLINANVQKAMVDEMGNHRWGIIIKSVNNKRIGPPGKVQPAFSRAIGARSEKNKLIEEARKNSDILLSDARREALEIVNKAHSRAINVENEAKGESKRLTKLLAQFSGDTAGLKIYMQQYRTESMREILEKTNRYFLKSGQNRFMYGPDPQEFMTEEEK